MAARSLARRPSEPRAGRGGIGPLIGVHLGGADPERCQNVDAGHGMPPYASSDGVVGAFPISRNSDHILGSPPYAKRARDMPRPQIFPRL